MVFVLRNNQAALFFVALTDMRYDLQDGERKQRECLRDRN